MRLLHIGRATSNDIVIADTTVSRQHAQLMIDDGGQVTLIDLSSSNGTFVNGRRISSPTRLDPTDIVKVGEYLLPWRQHVQASPQTQVGHGDRVAAAVVSEPQSRPASYDSAPAKSSNKKLLIAFGAIGGLALVVVIVAVLIFAGGGKPDFVGKWQDTEDAEAWIKFEEDGKYTEGYEGAIIFEDATWKAMGIDRLLIEHGKISISKRYKFEGDNLLLTLNGNTTTYKRVGDK